jgi:hypothetical protein
MVGIHNPSLYPANSQVSRLSGPSTTSTMANMMKVGSAGARGISRASYHRAAVTTLQTNFQVGVYCSQRIHGPQMAKSRKRCHLTKCSRNDGACRCRWPCSDVHSWLRSATSSPLSTVPPTLADQMWSGPICTRKDIQYLTVPSPQPIDSD